MDKDDIDHALHGIRIMMQVAIDAVITMEKSNTEPGFFRLTEPDSETLRFSLFDVLKRVDELKDEQSATAAPDAGWTVKDPALQESPRSTGVISTGVWRGPYAKLSIWHRSRIVWPTM